MGDLVQYRPGLGKIAGGQWEPQDEPDIVFGAMIEHVFTGAVYQVIAVLRSGYREEFVRFNFLYAHFVKADMADQPLALHVTDNTELFLARDFEVMRCSCHKSMRSVLRRRKLSSTV